MAKRASANLADAEQFFREAIDLDPKFALAYVGLADTLTCRSTTAAHPRNPPSQRPRRRWQRPSSWTRNWQKRGLPRPNCAGQVAIRARRIHVPTCNRAQSELRTRASLVQHDARKRRPTGRGARASAASRRTRSPCPPSINANLGQTLAVQGRFHEAEAPYRRAITIDPSRPGAYMSLALSECVCARPLHGRRTVGPESDGTRSRQSRVSPATLAGLYFDLGDDTKFSKRLRRPQSVGPMTPSFCITVGHSRPDQAGWRRERCDTLSAIRRGPASPRTGLGDPSQRRLAEWRRYDAALARYEKAYPELFVQGRHDRQVELRGSD